MSQERRIQAGHALYSDPNPLIRRLRAPEFTGLHEALYSWVAEPAEAWQIPQRTWRG